MIRRSLSRIDPMVRLLGAALLLASFLPVTSAWRPSAQMVSNGAIFLLFFLNGLRLGRRDVLAGMGNWRLLLPLTMWVFGAMALAGWAVSSLTDNVLPLYVALGFLYLGTLPSTVQSATAYSSLAGGNVATSVVAAALLNILGVFITAPIFSAIAGRAGASMGSDGLIKVFLILLLPFMLGQLAQRRLGGWVSDNRALVTWMDRISIAIAVYVAFSGAVEQGIWGRLSPVAWAFVAAGIAAMLAYGFGGAWITGGVLGLERGDRIAFLYAGGHKSIAMGAPLASVMFAPEVAGVILLPALIYHLAQLVVSAPLAARLTRN